MLSLVRVAAIYFLEKTATHYVIKMVDRNLQNLHILAKFLKFVPILLSVRSAQIYLCVCVCVKSLLPVKKSTPG